MSVEMVVWRIAADTRDYEAHDLSGAGAERSGGRWNRPGTPMVYASGSRALACLETVVHLGSGEALPLNRFLVRIAIPAAAWASRAALRPARHTGWDAQPEGRVSLGWGEEWVTAATTLVAEVPSVIVPEETNILINPNHRDIGSISSTKVRRWMYDGRL